MGFNSGFKELNKTRHRNYLLLEMDSTLAVRSTAPLRIQKPESQKQAYLCHWRRRRILGLFCVLFLILCQYFDIIWAR